VACSPASEQAVRNAAIGLPVRPSNVRRPGQSAFSVTIGSYAPFQMVAAAEQATSRIRLGTLALNVPFRNPAPLASTLPSPETRPDPSARQGRPGRPRHARRPVVTSGHAKRPATSSRSSRRGGPCPPIVASATAPQHPPHRHRPGLHPARRRRDVPVRPAAQPVQHHPDDRPPGRRLRRSARDPRHNRRPSVVGHQVITARHRDIALLVAGCYFMEMLDGTNIMV
jgi:hypothetical protein